MVMDHVASTNAGPTHSLEVMFCHNFNDHAPKYLELALPEAVVFAKVWRSG